MELQTSVATERDYLAWIGFVRESLFNVPGKEEERERNKKDVRRPVYSLCPAKVTILQKGKT